MLLEGLGVGDAFAAVIGPASDWTPETKGATITRAVAHAGGGRAVMIGDTAYDAVGAAENGIPCIGALWGFGTSEDLDAAGAAPLLERPEQLPAAVEELARESSTAAGCAGGSRVRRVAGGADRGRGGSQGGVQRAGASIRSSGSTRPDGDRRSPIRTAPIAR